MTDRKIFVEGKISFARFIERPNRFLVKLIPENKKEIEPAFLHDPGRMMELLLPNVKLLIRKPASLENRKTKWDILAVEHKGALVTIKSSLPNLVAKTALTNKWIPELSEYDLIKPEISVGKSRLDFLLETNSKKCYVETKGVTLVKNGKALFPDAPTERGTRHLKELQELKRKGHRAVILFMCMRDDPEVFSPNSETDKKFSEQLKIASDLGVEILVYKVKPIIQDEHLVFLFKNRIKVELID
ncbi:MAG: DNA/RNA nuclease SfsA [Candidatus Heimdallarchaeota archaeon]